jgi:nucleotide-binding universal stress UspA family protein
LSLSCVARTDSFALENKNNIQMTATIKTTSKGAGGNIQPYHVKQALVGLSLDETDNTVLKYFGFFTEKIPTKAACFVHVIPFVQLFEEKNKEERQALENYDVSDEVVEGITSKIATEIAAHQVAVKIDVEEGNPLDELLAKAEQLDADLTIIGKDTGSESHGILAKNFVRKVAGDAMLVPFFTKPKLENILVPFDFSPNSIQALRRAVSLVKSMEKPALITALNVYEMPSLQAFVLRRSEEEMRNILIEDRREAFKTFIGNYIPKADQHLIKTAIIEQNHPGVGNLIMEYAERNNYDMITMGARGHSKIGLLLMGSVTEKVLSCTKDIPVFIVKEQ